MTEHTGHAEHPASDLHSAPRCVLAHPAPEGAAAAVLAAMLVKVFVS
jgi:hypothetical protein